MASNVLDLFIEKAGAVGKAGMTALYPDEFEYYLVAFEILDSQGDTVNYFSFPVMPASLKESHHEINNVKKTAGGVAVIDNGTFVPVNISMAGTFGRSFKVLAKASNEGLKNLRALGFNNFHNFEFNTLLKKGYGCIKIIESIKDQSKQLDSYDKPHKLIFYNPVQGNNYLVKFVDFVHYQDMANNMIPRYELSLKAIGRLGEEGEGVLDLAANLGASMAQKHIQKVFSDTLKILR